MLPKTLRDIAFKGLHADVVHPGRGKSLWLMKQRFYWPGLDTEVAKSVESCPPCIRAKTRLVPSANLIPIETSRPLELVCIDFLSLEPSKGGYEKQKRSTEGCSKFKSPETRQVQERLVSTLEHMQVRKWDRTRCPEE